MSEIPCYSEQEHFTGDELESRKEEDRAFREDKCAKWGESDFKMGDVIDPCMENDLQKVNREINATLSKFNTGIVLLSLPKSKERAISEIRMHKFFKLRQKIVFRRPMPYVMPTEKIK